ncbi:RNase adapter RapZ [Pukyongiella litopenaei]|uniref:RNase adapter RapZ n=2 Tax=Pukyongiella litopenaei TaxID=2605946 RepID=A0A2S0MRA4_9RHOB|nr:RNase adapter RapZ [Pukyongiella litopenaei]
MMTDSIGGRQAQVILVTGPSGAGRSTAINVLEDLQFETIDNLPLNLLPRLLDGPAPNRPLALGIDTRNRDFSTAGLLDMIDRLSRRPGTELTVLYIDCREDVLLRRFSETRRRHPMAPAESPGIGIARELSLLSDIRGRADILVDTSDLNVHQLRAEIERWLAPASGPALAVTVQSFSYKRGLPRGIDMVFDCRFLANPYWQPDLRDLDGRDAAVAAHVRADARFAPFFERVLDLTQLLLPAYREEGKAHLSIGFGCTGGQHRSVALAEALAMALAEQGQQVSIRHRELEERLQGGRVADKRPD